MRSLHRYTRGYLALSLLAGLLAGMSVPSFVFASVEQAPRRASALDVIINEVAWVGTAADPFDQWIELYNPGPLAVDLEDWRLAADDGTPDITFPAGESIPAGGYFLLEQGDEFTTSETENLIYLGVLLGSGEVLTLSDDASNVIDTANSDGGAWPAGDPGPDLLSMERRGVIADDSPGAWADNDRCVVNGSDEDGNPINGTPGQKNSHGFSQLDLIINEVAWAGTLASDDDEWIELYNPSAETIDLNCGWSLVAEDGSPDVALSGTIPAGGFFLLERLRQQVTDVPYDQLFSGTLDDDGETLRLRAPDGTLVDTANSDGGDWPAGSLSTTGSMERMADDIADDQLAWVTNVQSSTWTNDDASGNPVHGTPKRVNWGFGVTHTPVPTYAQRTIVINEIAWSGTPWSANDEWIELLNTSLAPIDLTGWTLRTDDGSVNLTWQAGNPDIDIFVIGPGDYYLLERTNQSTTNEASDRRYTGDLSDSGEVLRLRDPTGFEVDIANSDGGQWPTTSTSERRSMERREGTPPVPDIGGWLTFGGTVGDGLTFDGHSKDEGNNRIYGTPGYQNWAEASTMTATPTATRTPTRLPAATRTPTRRPTATAYLSRLVLINEFLPRPGYDWNNDGQVNVYDEFIEIINADSVEINLKDWQLDDELDSGSSIYRLPDKVLKPGERAVYYGLETNILLSDGGDTVRLIRPNGEIADAQTYKFAQFPDVSECQYPEGPGYFGVWQTACFPTPGTANKLTGELPAASPGEVVNEPLCLLPDTLLEDFLIAECSGYGANMFNAWYWDKVGWGQEKRVPESNSQWQTRVE